MGNINAEIEAVAAALVAAPCGICRAPCACWGNADDHGGGGIMPMCDDCCGHGGEDGWCTYPHDEDMNGLAIELQAEGWTPDMAYAQASEMFAVRMERMNGDGEVDDV